MHTSLYYSFFLSHLYQNTFIYVSNFSLSICYYFDKLFIFSFPSRVINRMWYTKSYQYLFFIPMQYTTTRERSFVCKCAVCHYKNNLCMIRFKTYRHVLLKIKEGYRYNYTKPIGKKNMISKFAVCLHNVSLLYSFLTADLASYEQILSEFHTQLNYFLISLEWYWYDLALTSVVPAEESHCPLSVLCDISFSFLGSVNSVFDFCPFWGLSSFVW